MHHQLLLLPLVVLPLSTVNYSQVLTGVIDQQVCNATCNNISVVVSPVLVCSPTDLAAC
jgi:hypothetical protein